MTRLIAMLAEPGVGDPERIEVPLAAMDVDWETEADRGVGAGFVDEQHAAAGKRRDLERRRRSRRACGQIVERRLHTPSEVGAEPAAERDERVRARVMLGVARAHVIESDGAKTRHRALLGMSVARAREPALIKRGFGEVLVRRIA